MSFSKTAGTGKFWDAALRGRSPCSLAPHFARDPPLALASGDPRRDRGPVTPDIAPAARRDSEPPPSAELETPTDHPLVRKLSRRYSWSRGTAVKKKEPLLIERLPAILMAMPDDLSAARDRALLLLGYAGAFRRSELAALDVGHLRFSKAGLYVSIAAAKNGPAVEGARALRAADPGPVAERTALRGRGAGTVARGDRSGEPGLSNV